MYTCIICEYQIVNDHSCLNGYENRAFELHVSLQFFYLLPPEIQPDVLNISHLSCGLGWKSEV